MVVVIGRGKGITVFAVDILVMLAFRFFQTVTFEWLRRKKEQAINKILVVNSGFIGDSILVTPLIHNLRRFYKNAKISMLVNPKFTELWTGNKDIDSIVEYDAPWIRYKQRFKLKDIKKYFTFIKRVRKQKYDMIIDARGDFRNNLFLLYLSGAPQRVGFGYTGGGHISLLKKHLTKKAYMKLRKIFAC